MDSKDDLKQYDLDAVVIKYLPLTIHNELKNKSNDFFEKPFITEIDNFHFGNLGHIMLPVFKSDLKMENSKKIIGHISSILKDYKFRKKNVIGMTGVFQNRYIYQMLKEGLPEINITNAEPTLLASTLLSFEALFNIVTTFNNIKFDFCLAGISELTIDILDIVLRVFPFDGDIVIYDPEITEMEVLKLLENVEIKQKIRFISTLENQVNPSIILGAKSDLIDISNVSTGSVILNLIQDPYSVDLSRLKSRIKLENDILIQNYVFRMKYSNSAEVQFSSDQSANVLYDLADRYNIKNFNTPIQIDKTRFLNACNISPLLNSIFSNEWLEFNYLELAIAQYHKMKELGFCSNNNLVCGNYEIDNATIENYKVTVAKYYR